MEPIKTGLLNRCASVLVQTHTTISGECTATGAEAESLFEEFRTFLRTRPSSDEIAQMTAEFTNELAEIHDEQNANTTLLSAITEETGARLLAGPADLTEAAILKAYWDGTLDPRAAILSQMRRRIMDLHPAIVDLYETAGDAITDEHQFVRVPVPMPVIAFDRILPNGLGDLVGTIVDFTALYGTEPANWPGAQSPDVCDVQFEVWESAGRGRFTTMPTPAGYPEHTEPTFRVAYDPDTEAAAVSACTPGDETEAPYVGTIFDVIARLEASFKEHRVAHPA